MRRAKHTSSLPPTASHEPLAAAGVTSSSSCHGAQIDCNSDGKIIASLAAREANSSDFSEDEDVQAELSSDDDYDTDGDDDAFTELPRPVAWTMLRQRLLELATITKG